MYSKIIHKDRINCTGYRVEYRPGNLRDLNESTDFLFGGLNNCVDINLRIMKWLENTKQTI